MIKRTMYECWQCEMMNYSMGVCFQDVAWYWMYRRCLWQGVTWWNVPLVCAGRVVRAFEEQVHLTVRGTAKLVSCLFPHHCVPLYESDTIPIPFKYQPTLPTGPGKMPRHTMPSYTTPCCVIQCHTMPFYTKPCCAVQCHTMPSYTTPCAIQCHTIPCHPVPNHVAPYNAIPYYAIPSNTKPCIIQT